MQKIIDDLRLISKNINLLNDTPNQRSKCIKKKIGLK